MRSNKTMAEALREAAARRGAKAVLWDGAFRPSILLLLAVGMLSGCLGASDEASQWDGWNRYRECDTVMFGYEIKCDPRLNWTDLGSERPNWECRGEDINGRYQWLRSPEGAYALWGDTTRAFRDVNATQAFGTIEMSSDTTSLTLYVRVGSSWLVEVPASMSGYTTFEITYYTFDVWGSPADLVANHSVFATQNADTTWYTIELPAGPYYFHPMGSDNPAPSVTFIRPIAGDYNLVGQDAEFHYRVQHVESTRSGFNADRSPMAALPQLEGCSYQASYDSVGMRDLRIPRLSP